MHCISTISTYLIMWTYIRLLLEVNLTSPVLRKVKLYMTYRAGASGKVLALPVSESRGDKDHHNWQWRS